MMRLISLKSMALPLLAWLYLVLIGLSWWWNTKLLLGVTGLLVTLILWCIASRQTWRIVIVLAVTIVCARFIWLPLPSSLSVLLKLAVVVLVWSQVGTLLTSWSLLPDISNQVRNRHNQ